MKKKIKIKKKKKKRLREIEEQTTEHDIGTGDVSRAYALRGLLREAGISITLFKPMGNRVQIETTVMRGTISKFQKAILDNHPLLVAKHNLFEILMPYKLHEFEKALAICWEEVKPAPTAKEQHETPEVYKNLTLNLDYTHQGRELKFFLTTPKELISGISGSAYMRSMGLSEQEAVAISRKVMPRYEPRGPRGVFPYTTDSGEKITGFNCYIPPKWKSVKREKIVKPPALIRRIVEHIFPLEIERQYFYRWVRRSLRGRCPTILVLCGTGGVGKNRLKILLRALHGHSNTVDGKKNSLTGSFNSQLADNTLVWFDELTYTMDMENVLKELPNDSIAIERKGIDSTKSTQLHASYVISNNKERDNFIAFDARKFAPLVLNDKRLEETIDPEKIEKFTERVENPNSETFSPVFLAEFVSWLDKLPEDDDELFPNMEYRGPMFWRLAHTSMTKWQKISVEAILSTERSLKAGTRAPYHRYKGFLWSDIEKLIARKKPSMGEKLADYTTVRSFLDKFRDSEGEEVFRTTAKEGDVLSDFYIFILKEKVDISGSSDVKELLKGQSYGKSSIQEIAKLTGGKKEIAKVKTKKEIAKPKPKLGKTKLGKAKGSRDIVVSRAAIATSKAKSRLKAKEVRKSH